MTRVLSTLKALAGGAVALAPLIVFVVLDRFAHFQTEADPWYE